jgi:hypothetical protein
MSFLQPAFLWGLLALAIPIIIHLFHFRKAKKIYFSNTRFLQSVKKISQAKLRLKHYLILAARLLFITFLVLTFAQPFIPAATGLSNSRLIDIYLDNSYSMSNQVAEDLSGLDAAVQIANELVAAYPSGARFRLLSNDFSASSQAYVSAETLTDRLTEVGFSSINRGLAEVQNRLEVMPVGMGKEEKDVFYISDFQRHNLNGEEFAGGADSLQQQYLLPVEFQNNANVFVDTVYLEKPVVFSSSDNTIHVVLANAGNAEVENMQVSLSVNGLQVSNGSVSIPAKGQAEMSFQLNFSLQPSNQLVLSFQEFPLTFDNEFYFVIRQAGKVNIIEIKNRPELTAVARVYGDTSSFLLNSYQAANLDYGALQSADLVVVNGLAQLDATLEAALLEYKNRGGSLLLIPGEEGLPQAAGLLSNSLAIQTTSLQEQVRLAPIALELPFFEGIFEEEQNAFDMPRARPVATWNGSREDLLRLQSGGPFLSRSNKVYLLSAPLNPAFTNFQQHALFVPIMYKIAFNSLELNNSLYQTTNDNFIGIQLDGLEADQVYKLRQGEEELIPDQRVNNRSLQMELPSYVVQPDFYELFSEDKILYQLAFNHDPQESLINQLNSEELEQLAGTNEQLELISQLDNNNLRASVEEKFKGEALWKWALLLALLSLLAEVLLIRFLK